MKCCRFSQLYTVLLMHSVSFCCLSAVGFEFAAISRKGVVGWCTVQLGFLAAVIPAHTIANKRHQHNSCGNAKQGNISGFVSHRDVRREVHNNIDLCSMNGIKTAPVEVSKHLQLQPVR